MEDPICEPHALHTERKLGGATEVRSRAIVMEADGEETLRELCTKGEWPKVAARSRRCVNGF